MSGAIDRWDVLANWPTMIREFGWATSLIALFGDYPTFLAVVFDE
jgi:hypothetical protein